MVKMIALYKHPEDLEAFNRHYFGTHLELNGKTPGLVRSEVSKFFDLRGGQPEHYLMCAMYFESLDALKASFKTPESREAAADLQSFAEGLVTFAFAEVLDELR
ncbi:EthD family reductase [Tumebacillus lipolyticus]|uniref:EthD family reductase n=1 Tax=Tumebacillus lipolyticus TaxID=1280370 RepID=A0ABW5A2R3_9BACL